MLFNSNRIVTRVVATSGWLGIFLTVAAADPANGERLARQWCSACHVVASDQQRANADAPSFAAVAKKPGFSKEKLAFFLLDPHPKMPDMALTRREAADISEYVAKLGRTR